MKIEILRIADCPSWEAALVHVREALERSGAGVTDVRVRVVSTPEEAAALSFPGSPTILIDGVDAFPSDGGIGGLACRLYPVGDRVTGAPSVEQIIHVLATADNGVAARSSPDRALHPPR